jgi:hypothetical protein
LLGQEGVVERFGKRHNLFEETSDWLGPGLFVIAAGSFGFKRFFVSEPLGAQTIKLGAPNLQTLAGRGPIHRPRIKQLQNLTN